MNDKKFNLAWVTVTDFTKAEKFFSEKLGLELVSKAEEWGWMEFKGESGAHIGVGLQNAHSPTPAGANAVITLTVPNLEKSIGELSKKGVKFVGDVMEIPGHVKLQFFVDDDGNQYQLVEIL